MSVYGRFCCESRWGGRHGLEPAFAELFIAQLLVRNSRVEEDLVDQLFNSSEKRLARTLLLLANFGKEGRPVPIIAKVSQETLAEMIGTTRSRVSFFMNKFRKLGLIDYNGSIEIHSSLLNVVLRDQPQLGADAAYMVNFIQTHMWRPAHKHYNKVIGANPTSPALGRYRYVRRSKRTRAEQSVAWRL